MPAEADPSDDADPDAGAVAGDFGDAGVDDAVTMVEGPAEADSGIG